MIKRTFLLILISISLLLCSCSKDEIMSPQKQVQSDFDKFTNTVFCDIVSSNTINLHFTLAYPEKHGITDAEITFGDYGYDSFAEECKKAEEILDSLAKFDYDLLTASQQLTYDILEDALISEVAAKDYIFLTEALSPLTGYQAQLPILMANYTFRNKTDIENYLLLLSEFDEFFSKIMVFQKQKSEQGYFMPDFMAKNVIEQCETFIEDIEKNWLIETFNSTVTETKWLSESEKKAYCEENLKLVTKDVANAYGIIIDGLNGLMGTSTNEAGLCYYTNGKEYYAHLVRNATGSAKSVKALQTLTEEYIRDSLQEIYTLMASDPTLIDSLDTFTFSCTEPGEILEHLKLKITSDFPALPNTYCEICTVHKSLEESLSPAFFIVPPIDDTLNNVIYINNHYNNLNLFTTLAHEGYPGHLYQNVYASSLNLPAVRSLLSYPGYTEGWATYVEYYSYNLDNLDKNVAYTLALNDSATLGLYAYLDMGIHYDGWLYEDVLEYLNVFGFTSEETVHNIYETILQNPAEYLSYFIGYLEITELRDTAKEKLGEKFNIKDFHTFLLDMGPAPYDIIADYMEIWLAETSASTEPLTK
ncbi:MAG: DUF885 domain-containing protein [Lachnospiraceae bacterium]|nr:DUF885 domain-containing protein [Lachnospiraceae bacterium]